MSAQDDFGASADEGACVHVTWSRLRVSRRSPLLRSSRPLGARSLTWTCQKLMNAVSVLLCSALPDLRGC
jgi:hypothetical protein